MDKNIAIALALSYPPKTNNEAIALAFYNKYSSPPPKPKKPIKLSNASSNESTNELPPPIPPKKASNELTPSSTSPPPTSPTPSNESTTKPNKITKINKIIRKSGLKPYEQSLELNIDNKNAGQSVDETLFSILNEKDNPIIYRSDDTFTKHP
jgi:hypothetical protein